MRRNFFRTTIADWIVDSTVAHGGFTQVLQSNDEVSPAYLRFKLIKDLPFIRTRTVSFRDAIYCGVVLKTARLRGSMRFMRCVLCRLIGNIEDK